MAATGLSPDARLVVVTGPATITATRQRVVGAPAVGGKRRRGSSASCRKHASRDFRTGTPSRSLSTRPSAAPVLGSGHAATYQPCDGARFLTRDPALALSQDPYGYAWNNPTNFTDPSGLFPGEGLIGGIGDFLTGGDCGDGLLGTVGGFLSDNAGHIAFTAATAGLFAVPGANVVAIGFGLWSSYGNFRDGEYLFAVIDLASAGTGIGSLIYAGRAGRLTKAADGAVDFGYPFLRPWILSERATVEQIGRLLDSISFFGFGTTSEVLSLELVSP